MKSIWLAILVAALLACVATARGEAYRGDYIFGHEVNSFCPAINSQCYWLGPNSSQTAREQLKRIYENKKPGLYKPVCVVVEAVIDRESPRSGFAADYDGLIDISSVRGACDDSAAITPADLTHRRWVMAERNGASVAAMESPLVLDFGERLFVEGRDGCGRFSGFAALVENEIRFDGLDFDYSNCDGNDPSTGAFAYQLVWRIELAGNGLALLSGNTLLVFDRSDWR